MNEPSDDALNFLLRRSLMKVKILRTHRETVEIEVEFPAYRYANWGGDDYESEHWWKYTDGHVWQITRTESHRASASVEWSIERERFRPGWDAFSDGSENIETCDAQTFQQKMEQAAAWIAEGIAA